MANSNSGMGIHPKNAARARPDISGGASYSLSSSLSFAAYLTCTDREPNSGGPIKTGDQGRFEFGPICSDDHDGGSGSGSRPKQPPRVDDDGGQRWSVVRNNSIRRGGRRIRDEEEEPSSTTWSSVFRSFVSPCRECRASKPSTVIEARPIQRA